MLEPGAPANPHRARALVVLLFVTVVWGWSFTWMKQLLLAAEMAQGRVGGALVVVFSIVLRFGIAAVLMAVFVPRSRRGLTAPAWRGGFLLGTLLLGGFVLQMLGLEGVSPAVSAFLTSLYVVFSATITHLLPGSRVRPTLVIGAILTTLGAGFIEGPPQLSFGRAEWFTVGCAFVFAVHILATDRITRVRDPLQVTLTSFVSAAAGGVLILVVQLVAMKSPTPGMLSGLILNVEFMTPLLLSSVLATALALSLMNVYQREIDPVRAAVLYAIEPVWAAIIGIASGFGEVNPWLIAGGGALLVGNLVAEAGGRKDSR